MKRLMFIIFLKEITWNGEGSVERVEPGDRFEADGVFDVGSDVDRAHLLNVFHRFEQNQRHSLLSLQTNQTSSINRTN